MFVFGIGAVVVVASPFYLIISDLNTFFEYINCHGFM